MQKISYVIGIACFMFILQGCFSLSVHEKLRVDQDKSGNSGYISGNAKKENNVQSKLTRQAIEMKIECPIETVKKADDWVKRNLW